MVSRPPDVLGCGCMVDDSNPGVCECDRREPPSEVGRVAKLDGNNIRIAWCNSNGLVGCPARGEMFENIDSKEIDIVGFSDHGLRPSQYPGLKSESSRVWKDGRKPVRVFSHASAAVYESARWRGGTTLAVRGELGKRVVEQVVDKTGLGRYSGCVLRGVGGRNLVVLSVYRVVVPKATEVFPR